MKSTLIALTAAIAIYSGPMLYAYEPAAVDLTSSFRTAGVASIDRLAVYEVGGIVIIRGRTDDAEKAAEASRIASQLGYTRVANLVQLTSAPDDAAIQRAAERELSRHRSLDGCKLQVDSRHGVVRVAGTVVSELQKQVAVELIKNIDGVRGVQAELTH
ncbi:MAG TPA: BON domain-containing protein [Thermoanaerobaculia bacterium]|nr:BON domain-containing protein [Thermoanaerobaculia bacterium]